MYIEYPAELGFYLPDWVDEKRKVIVETKGRFVAADRKKLLLVKKHFPDWHVILVFGRPHNRITKKSKTTYAAWCEANGFHWLGIGDLYEDETCLSTMIQTLTNGS